MAHAYTPGLQIKARTRYRAVRILPIAGEVLVQVGQQVAATDVVAKTEQPGNITPINIANQLSLSPGDVPRSMLKQVGEAVTSGEALAISPGIFGFMRQSAVSPVDGVVESISEVTGQVIVREAPIPVQVLAFVAGRVTEVLPGEGAVIETTSAFLQGIFGVGGETVGPLRIATATPDEDLDPSRLSADFNGAVVVGGGRLWGATVQRARELGVRALIAGGIDDQELKEILGYDLGVAITGAEQIGLTIILTEGFGQIAMATRTFELLQSLAGRQASVNGATQIRAGVMRPEIVVPLTESSEDVEAAPRVGGGELTVGATVRLIRDPYFGMLGQVRALPQEPQLLGSGSRARVLEVTCHDGRQVTVPRANVELVGE